MQSSRTENTSLSALLWIQTLFSLFDQLHTALISAPFSRQRVGEVLLPLLRILGVLLAKFLDNIRKYRAHAYGKQWFRRLTGGAFGDRAVSGG